MVDLKVFLMKLFGEGSQSWIVPLTKKKVFIVGGHFEREVLRVWGLTTDRRTYWIQCSGHGNGSARTWDISSGRYEVLGVTFNSRGEVVVSVMPHYAREG